MAPACHGTQVWNDSDLPTRTNHRVEVEEHLGENLVRRRLGISVPYLVLSRVSETFLFRGDLSGEVSLWSYSSTNHTDRSLDNLDTHV